MASASASVVSATRRAHPFKQTAPPLDEREPVIGRSSGAATGSRRRNRTASARYRDWRLTMIAPYEFMGAVENARLFRQHNQSKISLIE